MSAHTPGPWRVGRDGDVHATFFLAELRGIYSEKDANARLIAAAPELLAALQATLPALIRLGDFIGNVDNADVHPRGTGIDRCKLIEQVRAAIAKAEGK